MARESAVAGAAVFSLVGCLGTWFGGGLAGKTAAAAAEAAAAPGAGDHCS